MNVELVLLRALAGEVALKPGAVLGARVLDRATIALAGVRMAARLPEGLEPGTALRVRVREASGERLLLQVVDRAEPQSAAAASAPPAAVASAAVPLPGGATARLLVTPDEDGPEGGSAAARGRRSVTLRYESPGLGRVDLALSLEPSAVGAVAHAPAGEVAERLRARSGELREALVGAVGLPAQVTVLAHRETFDVRA